ncbi:hypothetical protein GIB67_038945, partial [Kingdonia uniflora]
YWGFVLQVGNLGNLLIIIVPASCEESNSPFGDSTTYSSYELAYASLSMALQLSVLMQV